MSFSQIAIFPNTMLAHVAKVLLAKNGLEAVVIHEHFHSTYSFALGEIPLMVDNKDLEQAQQILNEKFVES